MTIERAVIHKTAFILLLLLVILAPGFATAQTGVAPRWEVFGGYSYQRVDSTTFGFADNSNLNGWNAAGTFNLKLKWSVSLDLSGHYGSQLRNLTYMIGPQYNWRRDKSKFFVHALFGKAQDRVEISVGPVSGFQGVGRGVAGGGGYDWDYSPRLTFRVIQADYMNSNCFGKTQNDVRISTGVVFHFGQIGHHPRL
ncbi:MAG TPA: hypothetical protein VKR57_14305 [Terriglobales bacterium]|nr:hypothetical protein [Terriglobales bacterium]